MALACWIELVTTSRESKLLAARILLAEKGDNVRKLPTLWASTYSPRSGHDVVGAISSNFAAVVVVVVVVVVAAAGVVVVAGVG